MHDKDFLAKTFLNVFATPKGSIMVISDVFYKIATSKNSLKIATGVVALLLIILALSDLVVISLLVLLSFLVSVAISFLRIRSIGIELVTFATVLAGASHGAVTGAALGLILILFHVLAGQFIGAYVLWVVPEYVVAGFLAASLSGSIADVGFTITVILNAINIVFTILLSRQNIGRFAPYAITNILFNWVLFAGTGQAMLNLVK